MERACGLDVHKDSVFSCIINENGEIISKKFGVLTPDLEELRRHLVENHVDAAAMESTSIYWMPVWDALDGSGIELKLVNPYFIRQLPGRKSDVKDAEWIATCVRKDLIRGSYVPCGAVRQMRRYNRMASDLSRDIVRLETKLDAALQRMNIRISNYVSSTDTKGYRSVVEKLSQGVTDPEELLRGIHRRTVNRHGRDTVKAALTGMVTDVDTDMVRMYKERLDLARKQKDECELKLQRLCAEHFPKKFANLQTMPGVKPKSAAAVIAETGGDMKPFETPAALASWCGLRPRNDESAGKIMSTRTTHGNRFIRTTMVECAWAAARKRGCFYSRFSYRLATERKKQKMKVVVAVARKMLTAAWHILSEDTAYRDA